MPYWIHENGETQGPMRAVDVLRRARPSTMISDGESWFRLDDGFVQGRVIDPDTDHGESRPVTYQGTA